MKEVLILASGGGTNAEAIIQQAQIQGLDIQFTGGSNKTAERAGVYQKLAALNVKMEYLPSPKSDFSKLRAFLKNVRFDLIVLAGYMRVLPSDIADNYEIVNIHPSILPFAYQGSEDAYQDALDNNDLYTGCTVHKVTSKVDGGPRIGQIAFEIPDVDEGGGINIDTLKQVGLAHEHALYFNVMKNLLFEAPLDMQKIAQQAQANLQSRKLPETTTIVPKGNGLVFNRFNGQGWTCTGWGVPYQR